ncbi:hypothetical protein [Nocardia aurantia]|uniref:ABM domain-containing protein n=1 Tax=Nocardia aurantia TaxID=2585199 RepID=A0A7K0DSF4_9NOCA|nr:hypothetical protein [Nocardia aurantia]MQY28646.1 hypothetical protein [Nocardia aurantia]
MATAVVVQYRTRPGAAEENQRSIERVFGELAELHPEGLRYTALRMPDGVGFVHVAIVEGETALTDLPAFREFQAGAADRMAEPPVVTRAAVIGAYHP